MNKKQCISVICAVAFGVGPSLAVAGGPGEALETGGAVQGQESVRGSATTETATTETATTETATTEAATTEAATTEDAWTFVITPQIWGSRVERNGFAADFLLLGLGSSKPEPEDALDVQWGVQVAAQKGRWSFAVSFQTVDFTTTSDYAYNFPFPLVSPNGFVLNPGEIAAQERVNTTRYDVDLVAAYFFPDVLPNRLDLSAGLGAKTMYATADRHFDNVNLAISDTFTDRGLEGIYPLCDNVGCNFRSKVETTSWAYGAVIPLGAVVHLTDDGDWLLPVSVTPFLGANTRDDKNAVFDVDAAGNPVSGDSTKFAYGATGDVKLQWALTETLSAYVAMRVQYFDMTNLKEYLAWGPLVGLSARFGGA